MIVNQQALRGIYTSFKVIFQKAFEQNETLWQSPLMQWCGLKFSLLTI